jgi:hypothetical protein
LGGDGIDDIFSLISLTETGIDTLQYKDSNNNNVSTNVRLADKMLLRCFLNYVQHRLTEGKPIGDDWDKITQTDFDNYRVDPKNMPFVLSAMVASLPTINTRAQIQHTYSPAKMFRRGIKRDAMLFPTLKDKKFNDSWHRSFINQAMAQDVSEVLDPTYVPNSPQDKELFTEKQKYVYAVLESKVLTDSGKAIVREFETTFDAQQVYNKRIKHHLKSTKARIESSTILSYITSNRLGIGEWSGSTEGFITHWLNQV